MESAMRVRGVENAEFMSQYSFINTDVDQLLFNTRQHYPHRTILVHMVLLMLVTSITAASSR